MLSWFRYHATWMLIIFGVLLMAVFGLGPVFDNWVRGFQDSAVATEDEVVAKWRGGSITKSSLGSLTRKHYETRRFLNELSKQARIECEKKEVQYQPLTTSIMPLRREDDEDAVEQQMIDRLMLAERAKDEGVVISDGMIDDYLALIAGQAEFSPADWKMINKVANQRAAFPSVREHLRLELKAMQMQTYANLGVPVNPIPTEAVELYGLANNRIECEVVAVPVAKYVEKVTGEPSVPEMKALFAEGQYRYEDFGLREPGFKIPRKVNVQYMVAKMGTFLQNEKNKISDEQVAAEYDKLVAAEDPLVVEISEPASAMESFKLDLGDDAEQPKADAGSKTDAVTEADADAAEKTEPKTDESTGETVAEPATEKKQADPAAETKSADPAGSTESAGGGAAEESGGKTGEAGEAGEDDQSLRVLSRRGQRVSFRQEETGSSETEAAKTEAAKTEAAETEAAKIEAAKTEAAAAEQTQSATGDAAQDLGSLQGLELPDETVGPTADGAAAAKTVIKPLADVAEKIRERMAQEAAFKKKEAAQKLASTRMTLYQQQLLRWESLRANENTDEPAPVKPDFEKFAADNDLIFRETGLVDIFELSKTDFGKVAYPVQVRSPQGPMRMDFRQMSNRIFMEYDNNGEMVPQEVDDLMSRDSYVYWLSEKVETRVPDSYEECRDKVLAYWKQQQAVELAKKAAAEMAASTRASGENLTTAFPEKAAPTGEFTWLRPGRESQAVYGTPFGVENPGEEFMKTAFGLNKGDIGIASNESRDTVYVIQRITESTSVAETGTDYLENQFFRFKRVPTDVIGGAIRYAIELDQDFNADFVESMDLKRLK